MRTVVLATPTEDPDRLERTRNHLAERGLASFDVVHGLHASSSGLSTDHRYDVDDPTADFRMGPKPVNIWLGHYMVWNALRLAGDERWLVLECDVRLPVDWRDRFDRALLDAPPNADVIFVGSCCTSHAPRRHVRGEIYQLDHAAAPLCMHAYVITRDAAEILVRTLRKVWAPIDIQWASEAWGSSLPHAVPMLRPAPRRLNTYVVLPRIADQHATDIPE